MIRDRGQHMGPNKSIKNNKLLTSLLSHKYTSSQQDIYIFNELCGYAMPLLKGCLHATTPHGDVWWFSDGVDHSLGEK